MIVIIIIYLLLQVGSTVFVYYQYSLGSDFLIHVGFTTIAVASYLVAHFKDVVETIFSLVTLILKITSSLLKNPKI
jgi:hypothetical protein